MIFRTLLGVLAVILVFTTSASYAQGSVTDNSQWEPEFLISDDGIEVVLVPVGCFVMGAQNNEPDESPTTEICFNAPFVMDRFEVTNTLYRSSGFFNESAQQPRDTVSWNEASAFCASRTYNGQPMSLPTEAQWEYAARGPSGLIYPWGDIPSLDNAAISAMTTSPVGSFPSGDSWVGAADMSGNVWEWTSSIYAPYPYDANDGREDSENTDALRVLRGGAATNFVDVTYTANRFARTPDTGYALTGFRCVAAFDVPAPTVTFDTLPWTVEIQDIDEYQMATVPSGCFFMGSEDGDNDETPVVETCVDAVYMDVFEITNAQYGVTGRFTGDNQPAETVTWYDAQAFCESRGGRLPTEAEWEFAARGITNNVYPWGNDFEANLFVWQGTSGGQTADVGTVPDGSSWAGVQNLAGNVSEWTSTIYDDYPYHATDGREDVENNARRTVRGGAYNTALPPRAADRDGRFEPIEARDTIGFRCVMDWFANS